MRRSLISAALHEGNKKATRYNKYCPYSCGIPRGSANLPFLSQALVFAEQNYNKCLDGSARASAEASGPGSASARFSSEKPYPALQNRPSHRKS